jgi:hypothetical protein
MTAVQIEPQPRIDTLVRVPGGSERRRTEYVGTMWYDGKPALDDRRLTKDADAPSGWHTPNVDVAFFVPDSLAYLRDRLGDAQLSTSAALVACGEGGGLVATNSSFVDDPSGAPAWIQLRVVAFGPWPFGISYRVVALTATNAAG